MLTSTRGVELLGIETQYVGIDLRAQNFFQTGTISLKNQNYQNAIAQYTEMLSLDPTSLPEEEGSHLNNQQIQSKC